MVKIVNLTEADAVGGDVEVVIYRDRERRLTISVNSGDVCVARVSLPLDRVGSRAIGAVSGEIAGWPAHCPLKPS